MAIYYDKRYRVYLCGACAPHHFQCLPHACGSVPPGTACGACEVAIPPTINERSTTAMSLSHREHVNHIKRQDLRRFKKQVWRMARILGEAPFHGAGSPKPESIEVALLSYTLGTDPAYVITARVHLKTADGRWRLPFAKRMSVRMSDLWKGPVTIGEILAEWRKPGLISVESGTEYGGHMLLAAIVTEEASWLDFMRQSRKVEV